MMDMLPSTAARFANVRTPPVLTGEAPRTIFLIQTHAAQSSPLKAILEERGFSVVYSDSVEGALRIWAKLAKRVDLFLADIGLQKDPRVEKLVELLKAENPRMRVLFANELEGCDCPIRTLSYPKQLLTVVENCLA